jgi:hypothetical protein
MLINLAQDIINVSTLEYKHQALISYILVYYQISVL